jgi:hypothetical protein
MPPSQFGKRYREEPMPLYNVLFITDRTTIERQYFAADADQCLVNAEAQFRMSNADHGELHEVVVMPPHGHDFLDEFEGEQVLEYYRVTPEGRRAIARY